MANCLNHKTKCNMTILCPTDFSSLATAACRVALRIASERGYNVHILHAYQQFRSAFQGQLENEADKERIRHEAHSEMKRFVGSLDLSGTKANVTYSLSEEDLVKAVHKYSEDVPVALVILGTEGATGLAGALVGSNSYNLAKNATVPVLIIPDGYVDGDYNRTIFFTDYQVSDVETLRAMKLVFGSDKANHCTLIHITDSDDAEEVTKLEQNLSEWRDHLGAELGLAGLNFSVVLGEEHIATVNNILKSQQAGLALLTVIGGRNFFERIAKKSLARAIILNPCVPVFLFNHDRSEKS